MHARGILSHAANPDHRTDRQLCIKSDLTHKLSIFLHNLPLPSNWPKYRGTKEKLGGGRQNCFILQIQKLAQRWYRLVSKLIATSPIVKLY